MAKAPTTYVPNTTAQRTRKVDALSFPLAIRPQAMTIYLRFVELGNYTIPGATVGGVLLLGAFPNYVQLYGTATGYVLLHAANGTTVTSTLSSVTALGNLVELCAQVSATGAVQLHQSINGGTVSSATASAAHPFATQWSANTMLVGAADGSNPGLAAFRDVLIVRGVHDLATMRKRVGIA